MAKMIPTEGPRDRDGNLKFSREADIYKALATLPDDYWVLHSYRMVSVKGEKLTEREADFVVFHPDLGILCIEAKAGNVYFKNDEWRYGNGRTMPHGGPYEQAATLKYIIRDRFSECGCKEYLKSCKIMHAVWFPSIKASSLKDIGIASDADAAITLSFDDLLNPEPKIREIFSINVHGIKTDLGKKQAQLIVERVLCPTLSITPTSKFEYEIADVSFVRLLESQIAVLDFIEGQKSAAIKGAAGTGKTLIAVEYAKRMSNKGEKTLYLCRTSLLSKDIQSRLKNYENADAYTIDSFSDLMSGHPGSPSDKCQWLALELMNLMGTNEFPYRHVIIDEGQDFGERYIVESELVEILYSLVSEYKDGTLYMFYDDKQKSMRGTLPRFIDDADCKLTLHVNCRNSRDIADCAICGADVSFRQEARYRAAGVPVGDKPQLFASTLPRFQRDYIVRRIDELRAKGFEDSDIAIVTCKTIKNSAVYGYVTNRRGQTTWTGTEIPFTTYTKFKGMEADAVILVDVDSSVWQLSDRDDWENNWISLPDNEPEEELFSQWLSTRTKPAFSDAFYIAASRAKFELSIVCDMDDADCSKLVQMLRGKPGRKPAGNLAKLLHAQLVN